MKTVYVVNVQWYEENKWHNTTLHAFSNKRAAQSYIESKKAAAAQNPEKLNDHYYMDKLTCWTHNFLKSE